MEDVTVTLCGVQEGVQACQRVVWTLEGLTKVLLTHSVYFSLLFLLWSL